MKTEKENLFRCLNDFCPTRKSQLKLFLNGLVAGLTRIARKTFWVGNKVIKHASGLLPRNYCQNFFFEVECISRFLKASKL